MDWLIAQNDSGEMAGKLDTTREIAIGYSWGGGAAIDVSDRPNIKATVSLHGMPPRTDPWSKMHSPLLLFTSPGDNFVPASMYVTPNYMSSQVQTFYATLGDTSVGHLYVVDEGAAICIGQILHRSPAALSLAAPACWGSRCVVPTPARTPPKNQIFSPPFTLSRGGPCST